MFVVSPRNAMAAPVIVFDYTYDSEGFFDPVLHSGRRDILELAADSINRFVDELAPIEPVGFNNTWSASFARPDGLGNASINGSIGENEIRIFVGGNDTGGSRGLAAASAQGFMQVRGDSEWIDTVKFRGQSGAGSFNPTDYGPWGGTITFNSNEDKNWYFGATSEGIIPGETDVIDFLTIATHEIGHLLGVGQAPSFDTLIVGNKFTGPLSVAADLQVNGVDSSISLDSGNGHLIEGTMSVVGDTPQIALMDPIFHRNERRRMTTLDFAVLADLGWELALAGDVDRDRDVDTDDLLQILAANSFNQGEGFGWSSGDNDADGDVDTRDILNILAALQGQFPKSYASEAEAATEAPDVIVNRVTGNVTVDYNGGQLAAIVIESASGLFDGTESADWNLAGQFVSDTDHQLANSIFTDSLSGIDNLGDGLIGEFAAEFDLLGDLSVSYLTTDGTQLQAGNVVVVPEPSALVMLSLGVLALGSLRGRRRLRH